MSEEPVDEMPTAPSPVTASLAVVPVGRRVSSSLHPVRKKGRARRIAALSFLSCLPWPIINLVLECLSVFFLGKEGALVDDCDQEVATLHP